MHLKDGKIKTGKVEHLGPDYIKAKGWNEISCGIMKNGFATLCFEEKVGFWAILQSHFAFGIFFSIIKNNSN